MQPLGKFLNESILKNDDFDGEGSILSIDKEKILEIAQRYILKGQSKKAIKELKNLWNPHPGIHVCGSSWGISI